MIKKTLGIVGLLFALDAHADVLSFENAPSLVSVGQTFSVDIVASSVDDLFAYQLSIGYQPSVLSAVGTTEGPFLPGADSTFYIPGAIDSVTGVVGGISATLTGPVPGVSGTGVLLSATFQALAPGTATLSIFDIFLLDSTLFDIPVQTQSTTITVAPSAVPEPSSGWLMIGGIIGFISLKNRCARFWNGF